MAGAGSSWAIKNQAEAIATDYGFAALPVCPKLIAEKADIALQALPPHVVSCSGRLIRVGDAFGIMYATYVESEGFQRFSIAHELGHYFIPGHPEAVLVNGSHESNAGFTCTSRYEREADTFAAALLMPEDLFRKAMGARDLSLDALMELANLCVTSLTSTAFRWVELSKRQCGVVMTDGATIVTAYFSEAMKGALSPPYLKGQSVSPGTITHGFVSERDRIAQGDHAEGMASCSDWFAKPQSVVLREQVIGLGDYGRTLTLLVPNQSIEDDYDIYDEAEKEESLIESWTPKFYKK